MNIWFLILIAFLAFGFIAFIRKWHDYALLFTIAIGFAVNANIYNSFTNPVACGNIIFAIDSILYTGFMFTIMICAREYGVQKAKIITSSTIAAILVSAVIELLANISSFGFDWSYVTKFSSYVFSAIGTFGGVWSMLWVYEKLDKKKVNVYVNFAICILIASVINSAIFYGFNVLTSGVTENFGWILLGSYIGKVFSILLGLLVYFVNTHIWIPKGLEEKYKPIWQKNKQKLQKIKENEHKNDENLEKDENIKNE